MQLPFEIKDTADKGRGVFAVRDIEPGEIIEECPVVVLSEKEREELSGTLLDDYIYPWIEENDACMVLGYGSIINHSYNANSSWNLNPQNRSMIYRAEKKIFTGEEITVNYNGKTDDQSPIDWWNKSVTERPDSPEIAKR